jgi:ubiquinone biosynthesis protein
VAARLRGRRGSRADLAHRLRVAFEALGATFVKLGQVIASADGMLPAELVHEFKACRDQVAPAPFDRVRAVLEAELGRPLDACFAELTEEPIAAASIAQVHAGRLVGGEPVVVKVQRPGLDRIVERDLAAMAWLVPILGKRLRVALLANLPAYLELFAETIIEELDFRLEAQNMLDVAALLARTDERPVVVPRPHGTLVTRRMLVMEPLRGFKIDDDRAMVAAGIDPTPVFHALLVSFFEGALVHGVFHGDLHGGNMMVTVDGRLGMFDFGITGRLSPRARAALVRLLIGGTTNDVQLQLRAFADLGGFPEGTDLQQVSDELRLDERAAASPSQLSPEELAAEVRELLALLVDHGARLPKDLFLFVKGMIYLNGAIAVLAADVDVFSELLSLFEYFTTHHGDQLSAETGVAVAEIPFDREHLREQTKAQVGLDVDRLTYRELRAHQAAERGQASPGPEGAAAPRQDPDPTRQRGRPVG